MTIPTIEFDPNLFNCYSVDQLETKQVKLGFKKKPNNIYVLSISNCPYTTKLETSITKIVKLLQRQPTINLPNQLTAKNIFITTQYLDSVSKIIERHNVKIAQNCNRGILKFLFSIPLINCFVSWYFKQLEQPTAFINQLKEQKHTFISLQLENIQNIEILTQRYNKLLKVVEEAAQAQTHFKGKNSIDSWEADKRFIQNKYESLMIQNIPALQLAKKIISTKSKDSQKTYQEILNLSDDENVNEAPKIYNQFLKNLTLDESIQKFIPASLHTSIQTAKELVKQAYTQWHAQRILTLYSKNQTPSIEAVLGIEDKSNFIENYQFLLKLLKSIKPSIVEAENRLHQAMKSYLEPQVNDLIDYSSNFLFIFNQQMAETYEVLVNQLNQVKPLGEEALQKLQETYETSYLNYWQLQVEDLMNNLCAIFSQAQTLKEKLSIYQQKQNLLLKWATVQKENLSSDQLNTNVLNYQTRLKSFYEAEIRKCLPIYAESLGSYYQEKIFQSDGQPSAMTLQIELNKDELWYQIKKQFFEQELAKLNREEVSPEIYESIEAAYQQVIIEYNKILEEKQAALAFQSQTTLSILSNGMQKVKSWITSPLKKGQEKSFDLTEIKIG